VKKVAFVAIVLLVSAEARTQVNDGEYGDRQPVIGRSHSLHPKNSPSDFIDDGLTKEEWLIRMKEPAGTKLHLSEDDDVRQVHARRCSAIIDAERAAIGESDDFNVALVTGVDVEESSFDDTDVLLKTRCSGVDLLDGKEIVWLQPGARISETAIEGSCTTPTPCDVGRVYSFAHNIIDNEMWVQNISDIADTTDLYLETCVGGIE